MRRTVITFIALLTVSLGFASTESRVYLARVDEQLSAALQNVDKAKQADIYEHAQTFHYDQLTKDIDDVKQGIKDYLNDVRVTPSSIQTLNTKYKEN
jgi:RAQPRD family integrative conjugative element protein